VDKSKLNLSSISPIINALSDHNVQILTFKNIYIYATINKFSLKQRTRLINNKTIMNVQTVLKKETWESLYKDKDPNRMFNSFLCNFLNILQASFPVKCKSTKEKMTGLHKEGKYLANIKEVRVPSLRTTTTQKHIIINIVNS
jgi:hypothetical protein